jgi:hypothetical protein
MPRSAAAHCSACQLTRSGRKRRKTDARSKLNRSKAWPWPGRASAVPAEVRIVAARGYLNKRCSNIAPAEPVPPRHTCAGRGWVSAAVPKHARASVAGRVASCPPLAGVRRWAEKAAPACPRTQANKQTKQQRGVRYLNPAAPWAEGRSPEEPRSVTNAGLVRAGARCTVQPLWAERAGPCSRCGNVHGRLRVVVFVRAGGWACSGKGWGATREGEEGEVTRSSSYISDPSVTSCNTAKPAVTQRPRRTRPYQMASPHLRRDRPTAHICAGLAGVTPTAALGPHR